MASDGRSAATAGSEQALTRSTTDTTTTQSGLARGRWALIPIVAASGLAGLGYEIVWTRQLAYALGSEIMAVLGAVAGFFCGVALGAFVLDRPIRMARSPWRVYALLEAVIGLWGLACIWLLPAAGRSLAPFVGTEPTVPALWAVSFALPMLVLLPATMAMGGTLTALERIVGATWKNDRLSSGVYGANTAGAVAGTLAAAFLLLPALGLSGTLAVLAAVNGCCAIAVFALDRDGISSSRHPSLSFCLSMIPSEKRVLARPDHAVLHDVAPREMAARPTLVLPRLAITLFASGMLGIAFEMLVMRLAAQVMQNTIYTFAGLLAAYLFGTAFGGLAWQRAGRSTSDASLGWLLAGTALACIGTAALAPTIAGIAEAAADRGMGGEIVVAVALFLIPSTLMGAVFGLLAQRVRDNRGTLGLAVGINAVGACIAPLVAAQVLIPWLGVWLAIIVVALAYLLLLPLRRAAPLWAAVPVLAAAVLLVRPAPSLIRVPAGGSVLSVREGPMVTASVVNDASGARYLEVNGRFRMGGTSSMRSDYRQAMLPLLLHPSPRKALFLGLGTGATLIGGTKMPGVAVHGVELSQEVVDSLPWFVTSDDARRARITVADARRYVAADTSFYDVVIADLFHPALDGSGALYTTEHFDAVRRRLAPEGIFCQWLPLYQLDAPSLRAIIRSFLAVYPRASAWLNHYSVFTPMLALIGPRDAAPPYLAALKIRLDDPAVAAVVRPLGFESSIDLLGQYVAGPRVLASFAGEGPQNTDDYPFVTFDAERNVRALTAAPWSLLLATTRTIQSDPAELVGGPRSDDLAVRLSSYWAARNRFLEAGAALRGEPRGRALIDAAAPGLIEALRLSPEFDPAYRPLLGMARALLTNDRPAAHRLLEAITAAAPGRPEAQQMLGEMGAR